MKFILKHLTIIFFVTLTVICFTACDEPVEIKVMVSPSNDNVSRGETKTFKAVISGMKGIPQDVVWMVTGAGAYSTTSIDSKGVLTVDNNETSASLTVQATLKHDKHIKGQAAVTVLLPKISSVTVIPANIDVLRGGTQNFSAIVTGINDPPQDVTWSLVEQSTSGTTINSNGVLTVAANETSSSFTVCATSEYDNTKSGTAAVTIHTSITSISITITPPVNGATPSTTASLSNTGYTISSISWTPADSKFLGSTVYTVSIIITTNNGYKFSEYITVNINGQSGTIINKTETSISASYTFFATSIKIVSGITIKTQPSNINYTHGDTLDLSGLVVTLTYDDTTTEDLTFSDFIGKNIITLPYHGDILVRSTHNNQRVIINYGELTVDTHNLVVNPKVITFNVDPIEDRVYSGTAHTPTVTVKDNVSLLTLNTHYTVTYSNNLNAGTATITITGIGNYAGSSGSKTFTILQPVSPGRFEYFWVNEHGQLVTTSNGATLVAPGDTLTITALGTGYSVKHWYLNGIDTGQNGNSYNFSSSITGKHTISLFVEKGGKIYNSNIVIEVLLFTVTFDANNATSGTPPSPINTASNITIPGQGTLERTSYTFAGWNTNSSGTGTNYNAGSSFTPTGNITLYARWNITYTITYNINNGTGITPTVQAVNPGSNVLLSSGSEFTRTGYTFTGWNTNSSGTGINYSAGSSFTPTGNITLYAMWNITTTTLTANIWANGTLSAATSEVWYSFSVSSGTTYRIWWNDSYQGNGSKTVDVVVSARYMGSSTWVFSSVDSGYNTAQSFTANQTGTVEIRVLPYNSGYFGSFGIVYSTSTTRPAL